MDFIIINEKLRPFARKMVIDEEKKFNLINLAQLKKNNRFIESDHNSLILDLKINCENLRIRRNKMLNLRNKANQEAYREETQTNQQLLNCFDGNISFEKKSMKWKRTFDNILKKCFQKVRIVKNKREYKTEKLLIKRIKLKNEAKSSVIDDEMKRKMNQRINQIEKDIGEEVAVKM